MNPFPEKARLTEKAIRRIKLSGSNQQQMPGADELLMQSFPELNFRQIFNS